MAVPMYGIVAGCGIYPAVLAERLIERGHGVAVAAMKGQFSAELPAGCGPVQYFPVGALGAKAAFFLSCEVRRIFFAGGINRRRALLTTRPDRHGLRLLSKALWGGDDRLLRSTADLFFELGLQVCDPTRLIDSLFAGRGLLAGPEPDAQVMSDIRVAWQAALELGRQDAGQAAAARLGRVVALEDRTGTDAMLAGLARPGAVLAKVVKPGQDRRFDMPAIGLETVRLASEAGLRAIAVETGGVLLLRRTSLLKTCNSEGISLIGFENVEQLTGKSAFATLTEQKEPGKRNP